MNYPKKSLLILFMFAVLVFASALNATETRVASMGGVGLYTKDNSNIFFFPGTIYDYKGQVVGELRAKNNDNRYSIGIHYPIGGNKVIGVYLNRPIDVTIPNNVVDQVNLNYTSDVLFGMAMSNYNLGVRLSISTDGYTSGDTGTEKITETASYIAAGVGISNEKMDLGLLFEMPAAKWKQNTESVKWSGVGFGGNARYFYGDKTQIVPLATFYLSSTSGKLTPDETPSTKIDFTRMNFGLGVGLNHHIDDNNLFVGGLELLGISQDKAEPKDTSNIDDYYDTSIMTMPGLYMGIESKIKPWLIGRLGAAQVFQKITEKTREEEILARTTKVISRQSNFNLTFGLGINFSNFQFDASINEGMFFDGPYVLSGESNAMANKLSITYKF
jgi:hypothetical protein